MNKQSGFLYGMQKAENQIREYESNKKAIEVQKLLAEKDAKIKIKVIETFQN